MVNNTMHMILVILVFKRTAQKGVLKINFNEGRYLASWWFPW